MILHRLYLVFFGVLVKSRNLFSGRFRTRLDLWGNWDLGASPERTCPILFHAASVGELEKLIPIMDQICEQAKELHFGITLFSPSLMSVYQKGNRPFGAQCLWVVFSPPENRWLEFFQRHQVKKIVIAQYEAWPGLWLAAQKLGIEVLVVDARPRKSLRLIKRWFMWNRFQLPRLHFFGQDSFKEYFLQFFPGSKFSPLIDPRWIRVQNRIQNSQRGEKRPRLIEVLRDYFSIDVPNTLLIASAYVEDLRFLSPVLGSFDRIVIVPHEITPAYLKAFSETLTQFFGKNWTSTLDPRGASSSCRVVFVPEKGFLVELFSIARIVWVGGGFNKGVHSVIEPALFPVFIGAGPKNSNLPEVSLLSDMGRLKICHRQVDLEAWIKDLRLKEDRSHELKNSQIELEKRFCSENLRWVIGAVKADLIQKDISYE